MSKLAFPFMQWALPLLLLPWLAQAQLSPPPVSVDPTTGLWWSPGENGHFMQLNIGPGGYAFATLTEGNASGEPAYVVMQGQLEHSDAARNEGIARLASKLYRVIGSNCLECGADSGQTVDSGRIGVLRFVDGTHAQLLDASQVVRSYELFPLYTRGIDQTSERVNDQRFLLTANALGFNQSEPVKLVAIEADGRCDDAGLVNARNYALQFERTTPDAVAMANQFANVRLQIGRGVNPTMAIKALVPTVQVMCSRPVAINCVNPLPVPTGILACPRIYNLYENGADLRGAALPGAGAPVRALPGMEPYGAAVFLGALSLQALPRD